ncbi:MAG TPA: VOC family protein [Acidimicrobiia bacterium]|nr:VOC family protein [Acidimicrobiia bacterium]
MGNPVVHFEVAGPDAAAIQDFYANLFDWKIDADNPMNYGMVDTGEGIGGGVGPTPDGQPHLTWYVQVDDPQRYLELAEQRGGKTVMPVMEIPDGPTIAQFSDPAGNVVGLIKG